MQPLNLVFIVTKVNRGNYEVNCSFKKPIYVHIKIQTCVGMSQQAGDLYVTSINHLRSALLLKRVFFVSLRYNVCQIHYII